MHRSFAPIIIQTHPMLRHSVNTTTKQLSLPLLPLVLVLPPPLFPHPPVSYRDHVSQDTIIPGPTPGSAEGAYWSVIEFLMAPGSGEVTGG